MDAAKRSLRHSMTTDYLIVGAGAVGLAFADTLLSEKSDVELTITDRRAQPGGHWNDAYSFVALHQPSAFYGVNSLSLGSGLRDTHGANKGLYELASSSVMRRRLLPSGRVRYLPMTDHLGGGRIRSLLTGDEARRRSATENRRYDFLRYVCTVDPYSEVLHLRRRQSHCAKMPSRTSHSSPITCSSATRLSARVRRRWTSAFGCSAPKCCRDELPGSCPEIPGFGTAAPRSPTANFSKTSLEARLHRWRLAPPRHLPMRSLNGSRLPARCSGSFQKSVRRCSTTRRSPLGRSRRCEQ